jgi:hypothetical protein
MGSDYADIGITFTSGCTHRCGTRPARGEAKAQNSDLSVQAPLRDGSGRDRPSNRSGHDVLSAGSELTRGRNLVYQHGARLTASSLGERDGSSCTIRPRGSRFGQCQWPCSCKRRGHFTNQETSASGGLYLLRDFSLTRTLSDPAPYSPSWPSAKPCLVGRDPLGGIPSSSRHDPCSTTKQ